VAAVLIWISLPARTEPRLDTRVEPAADAQRLVGQPAPMPVVPDSFPKDAPQQVAPPVEGRLLFTRSLPAGAALRANGHRIVPQGNTVSLEPGEYVMVISAPGFEPVQRTITLSAGSELRWSPEFKAVRVGDAVVAPQTIAANQNARDSVAAPPVQVSRPAEPQSFGAATRAELNKFARLLEARALESIRLVITQQTAQEIQAALDRAGAATITVDVAQIQPDSAGHKAQFLLGIRGAATQQRLLEWTEFEATFLKSGSGWALVSVHRSR
jgi:hypothetical protein